MAAAESRPTTVSQPFRLSRQAATREEQEHQHRWADRLRASVDLTLGPLHEYEQDTFTAEVLARQLSTTRAQLHASLLKCFETVRMATAARLCILQRGYASGAIIADNDHSAEYVETDCFHDADLRLSWYANALAETLLGGRSDDSSNARGICELLANVLWLQQNTCWLMRTTTTRMELWTRYNDDCADRLGEGLVLQIFQRSSPAHPQEALDLFLWALFRFVRRCFSLPGEQPSTDRTVVEATAQDIRDIDSFYQILCLSTYMGTDTQHHHPDGRPIISLHQTGHTSPGNSFMPLRHLRPARLLRIALQRLRMGSHVSLSTCEDTSCAHLKQALEGPGRPFIETLLARSAGARMRDAVNSAVESGHLARAPSSPLTAGQDLHQGINLDYDLTRRSPTEDISDDTTHPDKFLKTLNDEWPSNRIIPKAEYARGGRTAFGSRLLRTTGAAYALREQLLRRVNDFITRRSTEHRTEGQRDLKYIVQSDLTLCRAIRLRAFAMIRESEVPDIQGQIRWDFRYFRAVWNLQRRVCDFFHTLRRTDYPVFLGGLNIQMLGELRRAQLNAKVSEFTVDLHFAIQSWFECWRPAGANGQLRMYDYNDAQSGATVSSQQLASQLFVVLSIFENRLIRSSLTSARLYRDLRTHLAGNQGTGDREYKAVEDSIKALPPHLCRDIGESHLQWLARNATWDPPNMLHGLVKRVSDVIGHPEDRLRKRDDTEPSRRI